MEHELSENCKCAVMPQCQLQKCGCAAFCFLFEEDYKVILDGSKYYYTTISPNSKDYKDQMDLIAVWIRELEKLLYCSNKIIIVIELTKKHVPHFHIVYKVQDTIKHSHLIYEWGKIANIEPILCHEPKHKIHYLFKDLQVTYDHLNVLPVYTEIDLQNIKTKRREAAIYKRRSNTLDPDINKPIPKWMLNE